MMRSVGDLFRSDQVVLPSVAPQDGVYHKYLSKRFRTFIESLQNLTDTDAATAAVKANIAKMTELSERLEKSHREMLQGRHDAAWRYIQDAVNGVLDELMLLRSKEMAPKEVGPLFRVRAGPVGGSFERRNLFHIPFESRHVVAPQRYSTSGIPMLYLGSTLYICWEEMGRPDFSDLWVAALRLKEGETVRLLNLGYRPGVVADYLDAANHDPSTDFFKLAVSLATLWPLQAACSHRRRHAEARFVEEYIIPQLLTRLVVETADFDGIRYFSCRVDSRGGSLVREAMNFVFPAVPLDDQGYAKRLVDKFEMTSPIPWSLVTVLGPGLNRGRPLVRGGIGATQIVQGHPVDYSRTEFALIEGHLLDYEYQSAI